VAGVNRSVILSAVRTPFGKLGGGLAALPATELGAIAIRAALERAGIEPHEPQYVIMGQVLQGGAGQAPARQAAIGGGLPRELPSDTINKVCASSIRAVEIADSMIRAGDCELVVTGGMESMSNAPFLLDRARFGYRLGDGTLIDMMVHDGLRSSFDGRHMVEQASFVARELGISRSEQDAWAVRSHRRAVAAIDAGRFAEELVPVGELAVDEAPRRDTTLEKLAALQPVFDPDGTTTAGNAPPINDGASCVVVASEAWARRRGIEPLATSRSTRPSRRSRRTRRGCSAPTRSGSTSTAAPSRSGTRSAPPAAASSPRWCTSCAGAAAASASPRSARAGGRATPC
jgi:acetyl-CoA C-acetyltransferase